MSEWHVSAEAWQAYADGRLDDIATASIDRHVAGCAGCQRSARLVAPEQVTAAAWAGIVSDVRRPRLPRSVRWLRRLGVAEEDLIILAASEGFVLPWSLAVGAALICALLTALVPARQDEIFWLLAPTAPVFAVIAAFDATEQLRAIMGATPYDKVRLAILRTVATLAVAIPATLVAGLAVPGLANLAFVWLLPSLALTSLALALRSWLNSWTAAGLTSGCWVVVVVGAERTGEVTDLSATAVQVASMAVAVAMAAVFVLRSSSFRLLGGEG